MASEWLKIFLDNVKNNNRLLEKWLLLQTKHLIHLYFFCGSGSREPNARLTIPMTGFCFHLIFWEGFWKFRTEQEPKTMQDFPKNLQFYKFAAYGFLKNLKFFDIFFLLFLREIGISFFEIGVLYAIRQIAINVWEVPSGLLADGFGRKKALVFSFANYILSFILFYFSVSFAMLVFAMILFAMGEAFRSGTHKAMILEYLKINKLTSIKSKYYGATRSWSQLGSALSSLLSIPIVFYTGSYRFLFLSAMIPYLADFFLILSYPKELDRSHGEPISEPHFSVSSLGKSFRDTLRTFLSLFRDKEVVRTFFNSAGYIAYFKTTKDYLQPLVKQSAVALPFFLYLSAQKRSAVLIGLVYFVLFLLTSRASRNAWRIEKGLRDTGRALNILFLAGVVSVGVAGLFLASGLPVAAVIIFLVLYLVQNVRRPVMLGYLSEKIDSRVMASGLSAESQIETILVSVYAPLLGWMVDRLGLGYGLILSSLIFVIIYPFIRLPKNQNEGANLS